VRVKVRFFGPLRDVAGGAEESLDLEEGADTSALLAALLRAHPKLDDYTGDLKLAVNRAVARGPLPLRDGDEVALLPPVSGG
jgi:molybdopterin converting factor subunit 1